MNVVHRGMVLGAVFLATQGSLAAQTSPERVFETFTRLVGQKRWDSAAALVHPIAAEAMRLRFLEGTIAWLRFRDSAGSVADTMMSYGYAVPDVTPDLLATYRDRTLPGLPHAPTLGGAAAMPPERLVALLLEAYYACRSSPPADLVVGSVQEADSMAHVVHRLPSQGPAPRLWTPSARVSTFARFGTQWRIRSSDLVAPGGPGRQVTDARVVRCAR